MEEKDNQLEKNEIFSRALKAGRRTYFFDVRSTRGGDYYLTIAESKKYFLNEDGQEDPNNFTYKKHKIFLYKEDFKEFKELFDEVTKFILDEKGEEVISERHQKHYKRNSFDEDTDIKEKSGDFSDVKFEDL